MSPEEEERMRLLIEQMRANDGYSPTQSGINPPQQQQGRVNPMQAYNMYSKFAGGGMGAGAASGASGSAPIMAGAGQASATGSVIGAGGVGGSTAAPATSAGAGGAAGAGSYVLPAIAMAGLVKAGDKLKIGAKDQGHFYSKMFKKLGNIF